MEPSRHLLVSPLLTALASSAIAIEESLSLGHSLPTAPLHSHTPAGSDRSNSRSSVSPLDTAIASPPRAGFRQIDGKIVPMPFVVVEELYSQAVISASETDVRRHV